MHILFVCSGNTCRSPMAQALAKKALTTRGIEAHVESAGTQAEMGVSQLSVEAMARRGLDISRHQAQLFQPEVIDGFDLILCMEDHHCSTLLRKAPRGEGKIFSFCDFLERAKHASPGEGQSLSEWVAAVGAVPARKASGIRDPLPVGTEGAYEATAEQLTELSEDLAALITTLRG